MNVYEYKSPDQLLRDALGEKKQKNPSYSIRAWAKHLQFNNHSLLQQFLEGKKKIPKKHIPKFIRDLSLNAREGMYFETLIDLQRAKSQEESEIYMTRLQELSPKKKIRFKELESFKFIEDPLHPLLVELLSVEKFSSDPKWIQDKSKIKTTVSQIKDAIERLIALGIIEEDSDGNLQKASNGMRNLSDVPSKGVQRYHQRVSALAQDEIQKQDVNDREFHGYAVAIKKSSIPQAKSMMREFVNKFAEEIEARPGSADSVYQLNLQFFSLTK